MSSFPPRKSSSLFPEPKVSTPESYLIAHIDGGARGNPGPAGFGVAITDQSSRKIAGLSEYLGRQTNNFAEYKGLLAALKYAVDHGYKALKVVSDSELMVKQIRGEYKVKNPTLQELHAEAKRLIARLEWFSMGHVLREGNREADRLANEAMDKGMGRSLAPPTIGIPERSEFEGVVRGGSIHLVNGEIPEGTRVQVRIKG
ncbi:MAG TPA: ribonuclease HI family protein [Terriglobales bacterium]|nr:ribonuclease HI family protein [Terriglobales bacterium]